MAALNLNQLEKRLERGSVASVRAELAKHLDGGKRLNAKGWALLLQTYEEGKADARRAGFIDQLLELLAGPEGKKLLGDRYETGGMLMSLARALVGDKLWARAMQVHEQYFKVMKTLSWEMHLSLFKVAERLGPAAIARALAIHERIAKREPDVLELPKIVKAEKRARQQLAGAGATADAAEALPRSTDELQALIDGITAAGGRACGWDERYSDPRGLSPAQLGKLHRPGGEPLTPSMKRWLAFDHTWLPLFGEGLAWNTTTLRDFFRDYAESLGLAREEGDAVAVQAGVGIDELVIVLPPSATQDYLVAIEQTNDNSETPIFVREKENLFPQWDSFGDFVVQYFEPDTSTGAPKRVGAASRKAPAKKARKAPTKKGVPRARKRR